MLSLKETQKSGAHFASRKKQKRRETLAYEFFCIFWVLFDVSSSSKAELKIDPGKVDNNSPEFLHKEESVKSKLKRILQNKWVPWMAQQVKNLPTMQEMWVPISGSGSSPRKENGNPLQYSYLGNPTDRGAWQATVHGLTESDTTEKLSMHAQMPKEQPERFKIPASGKARWVGEGSNERQERRPSSRGRRWPYLDPGSRGKGQD